MEQTEALYFVVANFFLFAIGIGIIWTVAHALMPRGPLRFRDRLIGSAKSHLPILGGIALLLGLSYVVYLQFYPDTYECVLVDGSVVVTRSKPSEPWITAGEERIPSSRVLQCAELVASFSDRVERAFNSLE